MGAAGVWRAIAADLDAGGTPVLVTISSVDGSSPREAGARLVLTANGFTGTIGGGALEWQALARAQALARRGAAALERERFALGPALGQCCGGVVELTFEAFDAAARPGAHKLAALEAQGPFVTRGAARAGRMERTPMDGADGPAFAREGAIVIERFGEALTPVLLFGAGHVGRALVLALAPLPFSVDWIDARPAAFPAAVPARVRTWAADDPVAELAAAPDGALVLAMTHSHALDYAIVEAALAAERFAYVGVIGSATKRARFEGRLRQAGLAGEAIRALVCPIGAGGVASKLPAAIAASVAVDLLVARDRAAMIARPAASRTAAP
jgi:xanthine dehydrogenase accessory factor